MRKLGVAATNRASFYLYTIPEEIDRSPKACTRRKALGVKEFDELYREVILDHYKNPRGHGVLEDADAHAEGQNPLCGDEVSIFVTFGDGRRDDRRGQVLRPRLRDLAGGDLDADRDGAGHEGDRGRALPREELLDEIGIPLTPVRLKCALLGLSTLKVALHKAKGRRSPRSGPALRRPRPEVARGRGRRRPVEELPPGSVKIVYAGELAVGVYNLQRRATTQSRTAARTTTARCARATSTADDGHRDLPRHGANIDIRTGRALTLPASSRSTTYPGPRRGRHRVKVRALSEPTRCWETTDPPTSPTTTRNGAGPSRTSAACSNGSASKAFSRDSRG